MTTQARFEEIKGLTVSKIQDDTFYSFFSGVDESVLQQAYSNAFQEINFGLRDILDRRDNISTDGNDFITYFMANLTCAYMFAFEIKPYLSEVDGKWVIADAGALPDTFRTVSSQSMDGVSVVFESERLGIKIDTPFEQWLSVTSWGFRCIQALKDFAITKEGRIGVF